MKIILTILILNIIFISNVFADNRTINLIVGYKAVNYSDKTRQAIAVNNQIPAPTLHFKQGDTVNINVYNSLKEETAIHWHGILVPWQMDGVLGVTQHGIQPGKVFHYKFKLEQSGTYWYHAHAGLQEQEGLYGAFVIEPIKPEPFHYSKDYVVVLSDWSNTSANQIFANLKKEGDYYSPEFPLQPSLMKFIHDYRKANAAERKLLIEDYKMMQQMRMSLYDINDVAYDAFLMNGHAKSNPWIKQVTIGDVVRLRFIGAGASTIFRVKVDKALMQMVHVQGNDVQTYSVNDFSIAPGETYDVLVKISENSPYIIYAESMDKVGAAYGALTTSQNQPINFHNVSPFPEPLPVSREMMANMTVSMDHASMPTMNMKMNHPKKSISKMDMNSNSHTSQVLPAKKNTSPPSQMLNMPNNDHDMSTMNMPIMHPQMKKISSETSSMPMQHASMNHTKHNASSMKESSMSVGHAMSMGHAMEMPSEPAIINDNVINGSLGTSKTIGTKYQDLTAAIKTNDPNIPVAGTIKMELFGYMDRFIWFINGVPEYLAKPILLDPAKRYRFIFINNSMMHHPMHIHGHWFILRNGHGSYDPLLHTLDVPPGSTVTADVDTDASGQWFFHCHMLYHMFSGMGRVFQYSTLIKITKGEALPQDIVKQTAYHNRPIVRVDEVGPIQTSLVKHPMPHPMGLFFATFFDIGIDPFHNVQKMTYKGMYGRDWDKLELFANDTEVKEGKVDEANIDIFYWRLISQFWAIKGGVNYFYRPAQSPYWQPGIGIEGLMPYFIDANIRTYYYSDSAKIDADFSRDTQITNNLFLRLGIRGILASKTVKRAEIGNGLNQMRYIFRPYYRVMPGLNIFAEYEYEKNYGDYRKLQIADGEAASENTITLGLSILF